MSSVSQQMTSSLFVNQLIQHLMAYFKLSEQVQKLSHPQRSDAFIRQFVIAVRDGRIEAAVLPGVRFKLPKQFKRRGESDATYSKTAREMMFEATPEFEAWFQETEAQLGTGRVAKPRVSVETIESGAVDFKALAAQTRQRLEDRYRKGQQLGSGNKPKGRSKK